MNSTVIKYRQTDQQKHLITIVKPYFFKTILSSIFPKHSKISNRKSFSIHCILQNMNPMIPLKSKKALKTIAVNYLTSDCQVNPITKKRKKKQLLQTYRFLKICCKFSRFLKPFLPDLLPNIFSNAGGVPSWRWTYKPFSLVESISIQLLTNIFSTKFEYFKQSFYRFKVNKFQKRKK